MCSMGEGGGGVSDRFLIRPWSPLGVRVGVGGESCENEWEETRASELASCDGPGAAPHPSAQDRRPSPRGSHP